MSMKEIETDNKFKAKFGKNCPNFHLYQSEEEGKTVAVIDWAKNDAEIEVNRRVGHDYYWPLVDWIPDKIKGSTRLHGDDEWDAEYGKERAVRKALSTRRKLVNSAIRDLVRRLIRDAVQLDKEEAFKVMDSVMSGRKRSAKDGVTA